MTFEITGRNSIYKALYEVDSMDSGFKYRRENFKPENYIWDEDWTIKQNKEYTIEHNKKIAEEAEKMHKQKTDAAAALDNAIATYISNEYGISIEQGHVVWKWCCKHFEDDSYNYIDTAMELIEEINNKEELT